MDRLLCWFFGHKQPLLWSRDGLRVCCSRCDGWWLVELDGTLQEYVDAWLEDESFIRTDIPNGLDATSCKAYQITADVTASFADIKESWT